MAHALSPEAVRVFCGRREVDLVLTRTENDRAVVLHAEFDGHGDFFSIVARDVEYVDLPGGFTVGDLQLASSPRDIVGVSRKWMLGSVPGVSDCRIGRMGERRLPRPSPLGRQQHNDVGGRGLEGPDVGREGL